MFGNGNILHIPRYEFEDGTIKGTGKFLIVIFNNNDVSIIASLTTSQNHIPDDLKKHGCINSDYISVSCYHFEKSKKITTSDFSFWKDTFVYFSNNVFEKKIDIIEEKYGDTIELKGKLSDEEYEEFIYCIYKSKFVNRGIKKILEKHLENICN